MDSGWQTVCTLHIRGAQNKERLCYQKSGVWKRVYERMDGQAGHLTSAGQTRGFCHKDKGSSQNVNLGDQGSDLDSSRAISSCTLIGKKFNFG